jgi:hypothetical protein
MRGNGVLTGGGLDILLAVMIFSNMWPAVRRCNRFCRVLRAVAAGLGLFLVAGPLNADIQQDKRGGREEKDTPKPRENIRRATEIPTPQDQVITVLRGVPAEIVLSATASLRQPVIFRLGEAPSHGTVSVLRPSAESNTKAVVTYTAGPGTAGTDVFTFRVRHRETATSGSASVRVRIIDPQAELVVPAEVDFGEVAVGEVAVRPLVLENRGTAAYTAPLRLDPPWRLMQDVPEVTVAAGATLEVMVSFTPLRLGEAKSGVDFPAVAGVSTRLVGRVVAPVRLQPSLVQLAWEPDGRSRRAVVTLTNRLNAPVDYVLTGSPRLKFSAERGALSASGTAEVTVSLEWPDVLEVQSLLSVLALGVRDEVPLTAPPAPPVLILREAPEWQRDGDRFILLPASRDGALVMANEGGRTAPLQVVLPSGWTSPGYEDGVELGPRETRRLLLVPPPDRSVDVSGELEAVLDGQKLVIELRALARPPQPVVEVVPTRPDALLESSSVTAPGLRGDRPLTEEQKRLQLIVDTLGVFPAGFEVDRSLPELSEVSFGQMAPEKVPLLIKSVGAEYSYAVFREEYRPPPGGTRPTRHWLPVNGLQWKNTGETVSTMLEGLSPGVRTLFRFAVQTSDGRIGLPSPPVAVTTPTPKPFPWGWVVLLVVLTGAGFWWRRRRRLILEG